MPRSTDVFRCTMPATTANLKSSSTFFPRCVVSSKFPQDHRTWLILTLFQGANIDSADKHGISPLLAAIWEGHTSCVKFLVEKVFCSVSRWKGILSCSSLKRYFAIFLVEKVFCQVPRWKGILSSFSLKRYFVKFLVEKTLCLAPFWVKLLATSICPAVQLYNN